MLEAVEELSTESEPEAMLMEMEARLHIFVCELTTVAKPLGAANASSIETHTKMQVIGVQVKQIQFDSDASHEMLCVVALLLFAQNSLFNDKT